MIQYILTKVDAMVNPYTSAWYFNSKVSNKNSCICSLHDCITMIQRLSYFNLQTILALAFHNIKSHRSLTHLILIWVFSDLVKQIRLKYVIRTTDVSMKHILIWFCYSMPF